MYVLDTNTVIHYFKGKGKVATHLLGKAPADIAIPSIVLYELEVGTLKSDNPAKRQQQLQTLLTVIKVLPFTDKEAKVAAQLRVTLEAQGLPIGPMDNLIAGTALSHGAILVSQNVSEFSRVAGLTVENWFD